MTSPANIQLDPEQVDDLLGLGYGPAHLALSIALKESSDLNERGFKSHFLEKRSHFAWHPALLLPGSQLQVSPLKDLVTLRDPTSTYSFINFLHSNGRLAHYINKEQGVPSRREWTAYLAWAAKRMEDFVSYGQDVCAVEPLTLVKSSDAASGKLLLKPTEREAGDRVSLFKVQTRDQATGEVSTRFARNISMAVGGVPRLPDAFRAAYAAQNSVDPSQARIVHSGTFLPSITALEPTLHAAAAAKRPSSVDRDAHRLRLAVIGGGQSSTEMMMNLHDRFPTAVVTMIFRASALVPSDDTGFVNSAAFDPDRTDEFWRASETQRLAWLKEFKRTNYSVVRTDLLNALHDKMYDEFEVQLPAELQDPDEKRAGRMELKRNTEVESVSLSDDEGVQLELRYKLQNDRREKVRFDAVFLGTGFVRAPSNMGFLKGLKSHYPALDAGWSSRDTSAEEASTAASHDEDEEVLERRRERLRGITRDYRLVPFSAIESQPQSGKATPSDVSSNSSQQTLASASTSNEPDAPEPGLYVLGGNEATHGLSDSLLSIVAHRAGELTASLLERLPSTRRATAPPSNQDKAPTSVADKLTKTIKHLDLCNMPTHP